MARHNITRACGHKEVVNIVGPMKDRPRKIEWQRERLCRDCYRAEQVDKAQVRSDELGLASLTGTERQVNWAVQIRSEAVDTLLEFDPKVTTAAVAAANEYTDASFWIDNRDRLHTPRGIVIVLQDALTKHLQTAKGGA